MFFAKKKPICFLMDGSASIIENKDISCNCYPYDVKLLIRY